MAHFIELPNISAGGKTPEQALTELRIAWAMVKDSYREDGEPVPQPTYRARQAA
jgi:predicted RNase H-like HicB family nuclease